MKEKTTKLAILAPILSKTQLMNHMDCQPIPTDYFRVSFKRTVLGNRCPPNIIDDVLSTIRPEYVHNWKFDRDGGGVLYKEALKKEAKEARFTDIRIVGKKRVKTIYVTSVEKEYLDHDKKVRRWAERLRRKGIIVYPVSCSVSDDTCKVPRKKDFLKAIHAPKDEAEK